MKFRKKPVVIEAHRIGDDGWPDSIWQGVNEQKIILHLGTINKRTVGHVDIATLEGTMRGEVGDWIIRGMAGEFYPIRDSIFRATYEPVGDSAAPSQPDIIEEMAELVKTHARNGGCAEEDCGCPGSQLSNLVDKLRVEFREAAPSQPEVCKHGIRAPWECKDCLYEAEAAPSVQPEPRK